MSNWPITSPKKRPNLQLKDVNLWLLGVACHLNWSNLEQILGAWVPGYHQPLSKIFQAILNHHWLGCPYMLLKFSQILRDTPNCLTLDENCGRKRNGSVWVVRFFQTFCEYSKVDSNVQAPSLRSWGYPHVCKPTNKKARLIIKSVATRVGYNQTLTYAPSPIQAAQQLLALRPILVTSLQSWDWNPPKMVMILMMTLQNRPTSSSWVEFEGCFQAPQNLKDACSKYLYVASTHVVSCLLSISFWSFLTYWEL